jgi:hypothetical protein
MRKRFWLVAMLAAAVMVVFAVSSAPVGARPVISDNPAADQAGGGSANNPKADVQQGNHFCGANHPEFPVIGFVNYHRSGTTVSVNFHLKGAAAKTSYRIELWGDTCTRFGILGTVTTNPHGVANLTGSATVPAASTRFFATAFGPNGYNDTPAVTLSP